MIHWTSIFRGWGDPAAHYVESKPTLNMSSQHASQVWQMGNSSGVMIRSCLSWRMVWNRQERRLNNCQMGTTLSSWSGQERALRQDRGVEGSWPQQMIGRCGQTWRSSSKEIAHTRLRPDIVLNSTLGRKNGVGPWAQAQEISRPYPQESAKWMEGLEFTSRGRLQGFAGQSLWRTLGLLGIKGMARKRLVGKVTEHAERPSHWIWIQREVRCMAEATCWRTNNDTELGGGQQE